jgi:hypothetical protein
VIEPSLWADADYEARVHLNATLRASGLFLMSEDDTTNHTNSQSNALMWRVQQKVRPGRGLQPGAHRCGVDLSGADPYAVHCLLWNVCCVLSAADLSRVHLSRVDLSLACTSTVCAVCLCLPVVRACPCC